MPLLPIALLLDALFGYPDRLYRAIRHPVSFMGMLISSGDRLLNKTTFSTSGRYILGSALLLSMLLVSIAVGIVLERFLQGWLQLIELVLVSSLLATKSLADHVKNVSKALSQDIGSARMSVGKIVGRDTAEMDEAAVSRATLESLAENFSDGIIAPALFYAAFGLPGILAYKMVNTADSMIGHKNDKHMAFGWASARTDDLLNLIPARVTAMLILLIRPNQLKRNAKILFRDAPKHVSPNAGWPETALACVLQIRLGGPRRYKGQMLEGVWLGSGDGEANASSIGFALKIYWQAVALFWLFVAIPATATVLTG